MTSRTIIKIEDDDNRDHVPRSSPVKESLSPDVNTSHSAPAGGCAATGHYHQGMGHSQSHDNRPPPPPTMHARGGSHRRAYNGRKDYYGTPGHYGPAGDYSSGGFHQHGHSGVCNDNRHSSGYSPQNNTNSNAQHNAQSNAQSSKHNNSKSSKGSNTNKKPQENEKRPNPNRHPAKKKKPNQPNEMPCVSQAATNKVTPPPTPPQSVSSNTTGAATKSSAVATKDAVTTKTSGVVARISFNADTWWMVDLYFRPRFTHGATPLVERCLCEYDWTESHARRVLEGYRQFLTLKRQAEDWHDAVYVACRDVQRLWRLHIIDTENYSADCRLLCGQFVEHHPDRERLESRQVQEQKRQATLQALQETFDHVDMDLWNDLCPASSPASAQRRRGLSHEV